MARRKKPRPRGETPDTIVFGVNSVRALLEGSRKISRLHLARGAGRASAELEALARAAHIPVTERDRSALDRLARTDRHQGVVAELSRGGFVYSGLESVLERLEGDSLFVLLDGVTDPQNLGAVVRSAHAFGANAVIIPERDAAPMTATAIKASAGAALSMPVIRVTNLKHALARLKEEGVWCAGLAGDADETVLEKDMTGPLALVLGSEGRGMRRTVREACDYAVRVPLVSDFDSLNVSVAAGVVLYEVCRQRSSAGQQSR